MAALARASRCVPAYHRDPTLKALMAKVTRCSPAGPNRWHVTLDDTILYPTGGGQPCDTGTLTPLGEPGAAAAAASGCASSPVLVLSVSVAPAAAPETGLDGEGGVGPVAAVLHEVSSPVPEGMPVRVELDWPRRLDHMQTHTAQHLLSGVVLRLCGAPTASWSMPPHGDAPSSDPTASAASILVEPAAPDQRLRLLSAAGLAELEAEANALIRAALPVVTQEYEMGPEGEGLPQGLLACLRGDLPLPDKRKGQALRVVDIGGGVDVAPCGGVYVGNTAELQLLQIIRSEAVKGGRVRLWYVAGQRALALGSALMVERTAACKLLGDTHQGGLLASLQRLVAKQRTSATDCQSLLADLVRAEGPALVATASGGVGAAITQQQQQREQPVVVMRRYAVCESRAMAQLAATVVSASPRTAVLLLADSCVGGKEGCIVLAGPLAVVDAAAPGVLAALGGSGRVVRGVLQAKLAAGAPPSEAALQCAGQAVRAAAQGEQSGGSFAGQEPLTKYFT